MSGGGGGSTNTIEKSDPWSGVQPHLESLYQAAGQHFQGPGEQFFPNATYVAQSPETQQSLQMAAQRATQGSSLTPTAQQEALRTLSGQYLSMAPGQPQQAAAASGAYLNANPAMPYQRFATEGGFLGSNPYLDQMFNTQADAVTRQFTQATAPQTTSMFARGGRYGSNAHQTAMDLQNRALGSTLQGMAAQTYGGAYERERQLQQQAANMLASTYGQERGYQQQAAQSLNEAFARERLNQLGQISSAPGLAEADYADVSRLAQVGQAREDFARQQLQDQMARWNFYQQQPYNRMQQYSQLLQGGSGYGTQQTTQDIARNPLAGAVGGASLGYAAGGAIGGAEAGSSAGIYGALIGAGLGYLLG